VTRAEFDAVIELLNERGEIINGIRRELQTQLTRIAQLQQELDELKTRHARG
jgi:prefoldin subunit 5